MSDQELILPRRKRRRASFSRYRKDKEEQPPKKRKPRKKTTKKTKKKTAPVRVPYVPKGSNIITISISDEAFASIQMMPNKSGWIDRIIREEIRRIYQKHGREWQEWPK